MLCSSFSPLAPVLTHPGGMLVHFPFFVFVSFVACVSHGDLKQISVYRKQFSQHKAASNNAIGVGLQKLRNSIYRGLPKVWHAINNAKNGLQK